MKSATGPVADRRRRESMTQFGYREVSETEKVKWVHRHFDTVAGKYDLMNSLLSFGIHHLWKRTAVKMLSLKEGDLVLDLCGGTADLSLLAAGDVGPSSKVIVYDINRSMMERGRSKSVKSSYRDRVHYVQGNAELISFGPRLFDAVMVGFGIRNLTHIETGFEEIYRVLKPGGKFMCLEFSEPAPPLFRWLYDLYSFTLMPLLGALIVGSKQAYTYLPESIRLFPSPTQLKTKLEGIGFTRVTYRKLTNGIAVVHLGIKG